MNALDLDNVYTRLCNRMSDVGEDAAPLFLSRFALLAITRVLDAPTAMTLIEDAADGMDQIDVPPHSLSIRG